MGDSTELVKVIAESVPLKDAYEDVAQPVARQAGQALGQIGGLVNAALRPLRTIQLAWDTVFDRLDAWLEPKLSGLPPEQIVEPPPNVAGGVVTGLLFAQNDDVLRELFVQLLATGMTRQTSQLAHPAFAEFIKQMTSLEARLIRAMARHGDIATLTIRGYDRSDQANSSALHPHRGLSSDGFVQILGNPPEGGWVAEHRLTSVDVPEAAPPMEDIAAGFGNLERLGLVKSSTEVTFSETLRYCKIATCERALVFYDRIAEGDAIAGLHPGIISVTDLGRRFMRACLPRRSKKGAG